MNEWIYKIQVTEEEVLSVVRGSDSLQQLPENKWNQEWVCRGQLRQHQRGGF
jgi:hypothetical protein